MLSAALEGVVDVIGGSVMGFISFTPARKYNFLHVQSKTSPLPVPFFTVELQNSVLHKSVLGSCITHCDKKGIMSHEVFYNPLLAAYIFPSFRIKNIKLCSTDKITMMRGYA